MTYPELDYAVVNATTPTRREMFIYGMSEDEIYILHTWSMCRGVNVDGHLFSKRTAWLEAGGRLPITAAEALFLKPKKAAQCLSKSDPATCQSLSATRRKRLPAPSTT